MFVHDMFEKVRGFKMCNVEEIAILHILCFTILGFEQCQSLILIVNGYRLQL